MNCRLFLIYLIAIVASLNAMQMPILKDATFSANNQRVVRGNLAPFIQGANPPYIVLPIQGQNGEVAFIGGTPNFTFTFDPHAAGPGIFRYQLYTDQGMTPSATVTIHQGQEKG